MGEKMAVTVSPLSMIKKTYHQWYHLTCPFEVVLLNDRSDLGNIHA